MNDRPYYNRPQDELPYERQMKCIIEDYRKLLDANEKLISRLRFLEDKLDNTNMKFAKSKIGNKTLVEKNVTINRRRKRLQAHLLWLYDVLREIKLYCDNREAVPDNLWPNLDAVSVRDIVGDDVEEDNND